MPKGKVTKKPDLNSKAGKYFLNKHKGMNKKESAIAAGYTSGAHVSVIENSLQYREIVKTYKDVLMDLISMEAIAQAHADNITQTEDKGARNAAIKMAIDRIEPENKITDTGDKLVVVLR